MSRRKRKGPGRLARRIAWKVARLLNRGRYRCYEIHGYRIYLNIDESIMMYSRSRGAYEPQVRRLLERLLRPGMRFVDVGSNKGDHALLASRLVGPAGEVIAFEPEPENCHWIRRSAQENGYRHLRLEEAALSDRSGTAVLHLGRKSGWHTLIPGQRHREEGSVAVRTLRLDDLRDELGHVDCMKVDVEGAEHLVVAGARGTLLRDRPVVVMDLHPQLGADLDAVERFFREAGYEVQDIASDRVLEALPRDASEVAFIPRHPAPPGSRARPAPAPGR